MLACIKGGGYNCSTVHILIHVQHLHVYAHINEMTTTSTHADIFEGESSYSFVTCGCHADHVEGFKNGGLKKILSGCRSW